jgi:hypothetical protein
LFGRAVPIKETQFIAQQQNSADGLKNAAHKGLSFTAIFAFIKVIGSTLPAPDPKR